MRLPRPGTVTWGSVALILGSVAVALGISSRGGPAPGPAADDAFAAKLPPVPAAAERALRFELYDDDCPPLRAIARV
jgi:hypothetical protein